MRKSGSSEFILQSKYAKLIEAYSSLTLGIAQDYLKSIQRGK